MYSKTNLTSLLDELLLQITHYLNSASDVSALTGTNKRFYHIAGKGLYNPKGKLSGSVKERMRKATQYGNTIVFDRMFTHVNVPWSALELATALIYKQESMAIRLLGHDNIKQRVSQATRTRANNHILTLALPFLADEKMHSLLRFVLQIQGVNPNFRCDGGETLLHKKSMDFETRKILLEAGADATALSMADGQTTLRRVIRCAASVEVLLGHGAFPSVEDRKLVMDYGDFSVVLVLLHWGLRRWGYGIWGGP